MQFTSSFIIWDCKQEVKESNVTTAALNMLHTGHGSGSNSSSSSSSSSSSGGGGGELNTYVHILTTINLLHVTQAIRIVTKFATVHL